MPSLTYTSHSPQHLDLGEIQGDYGTFRPALVLQVLIKISHVEELQGAVLGVPVRGVNTSDCSPAAFYPCSGCSPL